MAENSAAPLAGRPGISYFAPGVRIMKLDALQAGAQAGTPLPGDVMGDVQRVEVVRSNTGASQYTIVLNNWYTTTAADRRAQASDGERELAGRSNPPWPRYKYNDFALLAFGQRLRIDLRYWPEGHDDQASPKDWVPMVSGPITDMRFGFGDSGAIVTISGEDDLSQLKDRVENRQQFDEMGERALVERILSLANYPLNTIAPSTLEWPSFTAQAGPAEAIQDGQSYLEYLQKIAEKLDFEVFLEFADLRDGDQGLAFHFEPYRARAVPDTSDADLFLLRRDRNLLEFAPTLKVVDQPSSTTVRGRHRDRNQPRRVDQSAQPSVIQDELHTGDGDAPLVTGPEVRDHFYPNRPNPLVSPNETNLDDERARRQAEGELCRKAREFLTIDATTIGLPRLRPGKHVEIRGFRPPFDGFYYVTRTVHSFGADGFRTQLSACRPGMPLPPYGEGD